MGLSQYQIIIATVNMLLSVSFLAFDMSDEMDDVGIIDRKCKCLTILGTIHMPIVSADMGISSI